MQHHKNKVISTLKEDSGTMRLKCDNKCGLVDYCGCVPETWSRSATLTSVRRGFLGNRMINENIKIYPVWDSTIETVPRNISNEEMSLLKNYHAIRTCYFEQKLKDQVEEENLDSLQFPLDKDSHRFVQDGLRWTKVVHCQRARTLSTEAMRQIHSELVSKFRAAQDDKNLKIKAESENFMISNKECEECRTEELKMT